ncbi:MAG: hypothetical protein JNL50_14695, partial [Phycisphaerae bacterium]|nr:hypothetical protein [Phycisphaerae bacterium]
MNPAHAPENDHMHNQDNQDDTDHDDTAAGRLDGVRVLIVDDDRDVLESIDAAFQAEGALTQLASDGN